MTGGPSAPRTRKPAAERRAEILAVAARIALEEGLERITLRAVADRLAVRPGLIGHYFPAVGDLVVAAFSLAVSGERERLLPGDSGSPADGVADRVRPLDGLAAFVSRVEGEDAAGLARLWLNARHLARFDPELAAAIEEQEALDRARLEGLIERGIAAGDFPIPAAEAGAACVRIFMAADGFGAYANNAGAFPEPAYERFVGDVAAWALGLDPSALRERIASR